MATIEKIYLQDQNNTPQPYDIGAKAANITYDESDTSASITSVQGKIKNIDNDHINGTVYSSQGKHKLRYQNNKLEVDTTGSGNQTAVGGGGEAGKYINILSAKADVANDGTSSVDEPGIIIKQSENSTSDYTRITLVRKAGTFPTTYNDGVTIFETAYPSPIAPENGYIDTTSFTGDYQGTTYCYAFFLSPNSSQNTSKKDATFSVVMDSYKENRYGTSIGAASHSEGGGTFATECAAHAEGFGTCALGIAAHAEGYLTKASEMASHAEGFLTSANGDNSHAEGYTTIAVEEYSHAEGYYTSAVGKGSHAEGGYIDTGYGATPGTYAIGMSSHAEGVGTYAQGNGSHAEGGQDGTLLFPGTFAIGANSHAEGYQTTAQGYASHAEGINTLITTNAEGSHVEGRLTCVDALVAHAQGYHTCASNVASCSIGHYNAAMTTGGTYTNTTGTAFVIGNGGGVNSNAFSVQFDGTVAAANTITASTAADYAEFFEWADENPDSEDRVGHFVTIDDLDTTKIRIANAEDDYILGIVSGAPFVLGNGDCDVWNGLVMRDKFGRIMYEPAPKMEEIVNEETGEITYRQARDEQGRPIYQGTKPIYNPEYDPTQAYIRRSERPEWTPVGMLGILAVIDDGTCEVGQYCKCGAEGIATAAEGYDRNTYRVIKRVDENTIQVIFR